MASGGGIDATFKEFCDKGNEITTANTVKWMKKADCFGKACTSQSVDIAFMKAKEDKKKKTLNLAEFKKLINIMSADYGKDHKLGADAEAKMTEKLAGAKNIAEGTKTSKTGNVAGMTDASKYTGSHKERFDKDGKGKGIAGRETVVANDGYVQGYKEKDSYDKKH
eukprot:TRINITY_DN64159_c0_g1_i1.p1 TRINITY_DN64159_c0_g1~~TRINITY_DN64159_c0_g1_i1.p1  ORF type:complete len:166 (+),score=29.29 TRINITY_DN64159_c0_g1_i1:82-579(+)